LNLDPQTAAQLSLAVRHELWRRGELDYKRHEGQRQLTAAARASAARTTVLHAARGYGKTYDALLDCIEHGLQHNNQRMVFAAATREDAKKIVTAVMPMLLEDAPKEFAPVWMASEHLYRFHNGTTLIVEGADDDRGNHLRGPHIHKFVGDEIGFWRHASYVYKSVILPQLQRVKGKARLQSTSPESVGHDFVGICEEAIRNDAYHKFTLHDNPRVTPDEAQQMAEEISGKSGAEAWKTTAVRRELLCEFVTELERAVVPEFSDELHVIDDYERPQYVDTYTFLDLGLVDLTHALFCYWDFERAVLVVEDEIAAQYMQTSEFAALCKAKEKELWGSLPYFGNVSPQSWNRAPWGRYSDNDPQILFDLNGMGLSFAPALKVEQETALHRLRTAFAAGKIAIHKRCKTLIHQLRVGVWNERRTDYERIPGAGHLDGIDALMYGWRMMNHGRNPIPALLGITSDTHHVSPTIQQRASTSSNTQALKGMIRRR